ncbi:hypothetical protein RA210_U230042 [Rubrivivax sp. A210]|uniref:hypothetical protein n=1 Tax=Rubrivivax sp. A210 TaxID=2772301 RepID=UPI001917F460|nr:hypothetical protein [Rubrivivax sp. A210]CAD5372847.1 hypothetical protein RA210_U230042 [Rubrivivax sp. A210]
MAALNPALALSRLRWRLRRWLGLPAFGPLALLAALVLLGLAALAWQQAAVRLEAARTAQAEAQARRQPAAPAADAGRQGAKAFVDSLPPLDELPAVLQALLDLADQQGLRLVRGSYRLQPEPAARFGRYRMNLPLRGDAVRVQRFVELALLAQPALAVESIQFKRLEETGQVIEAQVQWVLFVRGVRPEALPPVAAEAAADIATPASGGRL